MEFRKITPDDLTPLKAVNLLFYQPEYLNAQNYENLIAFTAYNQSKLTAVIVFNCKNDVATSLNNSPFGSISITANLSKEILQQFLDFIKKELADDSIRKMEITLPSHIYDHFISFEFWQSEGFQIKVEETNQHLIVGAGFETGLHQMERRKLRKLRGGKIKFGMEPSSTDVITECHEFITACRKDQGLSINIDLERLKALSFGLDRKYDFFTARSGDVLVAAAITCRVSQDYLYYYLPGTDYRYRKESPMVGLVERIYHECARRKIKYLDLGISSVEGLLQQGLYDFKKRLGASETLKPTVYLEW